MTSYGYANQWIFDPAPRNPGKTRVHRCPILVSKCKVDLVFGYSTLAEEFWDGYQKASVFMHPGGGGRRAKGGDLIVFVSPGVGHLTDVLLPGEGIFEPAHSDKTETNH